MVYSILSPRSDSPGWKIIDEPGFIVCSGTQTQCEEWLDLADYHAAASRSVPLTSPCRDTSRLPIFELASAFLGRLWNETDGSVRVAGETPAIFLMMVIVASLASQFVGPAVAQHASPAGSASAATCRGPHWATCSGTHSGTSCANSNSLDMACDAADDAA